MSTLVWDDIGSRIYETGLDRGVLYLPDGSAVPWNGLTSVIESADKEVTSVYYDGMKINSIVSLGDFSGTMKALTYPDEFFELEGMIELKRGFYAGDQSLKLFGLSWRTQIGSAELGTSVGYKIHILYNVTAVASDKTYVTVSEDQTVSEFEWNISATPEEVPGLRPTAHFVLNSLDVDPWLLEDLENILYGNETTEPSLIPMLDLITFISTWFRLRIVDNGDGTWSAISDREGFIQLLPDGAFELDDVNAVYLDDDTFIVTDTD